LNKRGELSFNIVFYNKKVDVQCINKSNLNKLSVTRTEWHRTVFPLSPLRNREKLMLWPLLIRKLIVSPIVI